MDFLEQCQYHCYYSECNRSYQSKYSLKRHIKAYHLGIKPYTCGICEKAFINPGLLKDSDVVIIFWADCVIFQHSTMLAAWEACLK